MTDRQHPKEAICAKQKKVTEQILRNLANRQHTKEAICAKEFGKRCENCGFWPMGGPHRGPGDPH